MKIKLSTEFFYLCGFLPKEYSSKCKDFLYIKEVYDSELQGMIKHKIRVFKDKKWICELNGVVQDNIDKIFEEFNIKKIRDLRFIYLLRAENSHTYKIGRTSYLNFRSKDFKVTLPFNTELVSWFIAKKFTENSLHKFYFLKRINGEWFNLNANDLVYFNSIRNEQKNKLEQIYINEI